MNENGSDHEAPQDIDRLFGYLGERLSNGWLYFVTAKHLHNAYENGRVTCARLFFMATYQASLDRSIAIVQEVVYGEDALLPRLLAAAGSAPETFAQSTPDQVRARASTCRPLLAGMNGQIEALSIARSRLPILRDEEVSDQAMLEVFSAGQLMGLQKAYRDVLSLVREFGGYYSSDSLELEFVEEIIQDDVDFLLSMLSGNCI